MLKREEQYDQKEHYATGKACSSFKDGTLLLPSEGMWGCVLMWKKEWKGQRGKDHFFQDGLYLFHKVRSPQTQISSQRPLSSACLTVVKFCQLSNSSITDVGFLPKTPKYCLIMKNIFDKLNLKFQQMHNQYSSQSFSFKLTKRIMGFK